MTKLEYEYAKGRLEGLREAEQIVAETKQQLITSTELRLTKRVAELEVELQGITVFNESEVLKSEIAELKEQLEDIYKKLRGEL